MSINLFVDHRTPRRALFVSGSSSNTCLHLTLFYHSSSAKWTCETNQYNSLPILYSTLSIDIPFTFFLSLSALIIYRIWCNTRSASSSSDWLALRTIVAVAVAVVMNLASTMIKYFVSSSMNFTIVMICLTSLQWTAKNRSPTHLFFC